MTLLSLPSSLIHEATEPTRPRLRLGFLVALVAWLQPQPRPPDLPDYLRQDIGLLPDQWQADPLRRHPVDLTVLHAWRR